MTDVYWCDHPLSATAFVELAEEEHLMLSVGAPSQYTEVWTVQVDRLSRNFAQVKTTGLLNGGLSRKGAKTLAEKIAAEWITE